MNSLKRNIIIAFFICLISLVIYTVVAFDLHCCFFSLEISENCKNYLITLSSGIFISTIVAMVFYINEYTHRKRELVEEISKQIDEYISIYSKLKPIFFFPSKELKELIFAYFDTESNNKWVSELKDETEKYISEKLKYKNYNDKEEFRENITQNYRDHNWFVSHNPELELIKYLKSNPQIVEWYRKKSKRYNKILSKNIPNKYTEFIKALKEDVESECRYLQDVYKEILNLDFSKLNGLISEINCIFGYEIAYNFHNRINYSKLRMISNENIFTKKKYLFFGLNDLANHLKLLNDMTLKRIRAIFDMYGYNIENNGNIVQLFCILEELDKSFFGSTFHDIAISNKELLGEEKKRIKVKFEDNSDEVNTLIGKPDTDMVCTKDKIYIKIYDKTQNPNKVQDFYNHCYLELILKIGLKKIELKSTQFEKKGDNIIVYEFDNNIPNIKKTKNINICLFWHIDLKYNIVNYLIDNTRWMMYHDPICLGVFPIREEKIYSCKSENPEICIFSSEQLKNPIFPNI